MDVATEETFRFVVASVPAERLRVLEVGCGTGELAARLRGLGHELVALDSSEEAVEAARRLGVDARVAAFPEFEDDLFDCVLFTRSLHHISPLPPALEKASRLLKPSGLLVVEDFAFSDVCERTAGWFYALLALLDAGAVLLRAEGTFGRRLLEGGGAFALWHEHAHKINTHGAMLRALADSFEVLKAESAPYLYRYVAQMVADDERGGAVVARALELEKRTHVGDERFLLGRRFVARLKTRDALQEVK